MKIDFKRRPALWASIGLHLLLLLLAALFTFVRFPETPDSTHVFEMLASDELGSELPNPTTATEPTAPAPAELKLKPLPKLAPAKPRPAPPKPAAAPPAGQEMSYEEFKRQHTIQSRSPNQVANQSPKTPAVKYSHYPKIFSKAWKPHRATSNRQQMQRLQSTRSSSESIVESRMGKTSPTHGVRLSVTVVFSVSAAGQIMQPRLSQFRECRL